MPRDAHTREARNRHKQPAAIHAFINQPGHQQPAKPKRQVHESLAAPPPPPPKKTPTTNTETRAHTESHPPTPSPGKPNLVLGHADGEGGAEVLEVRGGPELGNAGGDHHAKEDHEQRGLAPHNRVALQAVVAELLEELRVLPVHHIELPKQMEGWRERGVGC